MAPDGSLPPGFTGDELVLGGGSYATVVLRLEQGRPVIHKRLDVAADADPDRERHARAVYAWMAALPADVAELFPRILRVVDDGRQIDMAMEFVPGDSLADLVLQGDLDAAGLATWLAEIYGAVAERMWSRAPVLEELTDEDSYLARARRRTAAIETRTDSLSNRVRALFRSRSVTVNGLSCTPVADLLEHLARDPLWRPVVFPRRRALCHGDLTLDAAIISEGFRLIDPNPFNVRPVYDTCKTAMSLLLHYEFFSFDRFELEFRESAGVVTVEVALEQPVLRDVYVSTATWFVEFVSSSLARNLALEPRDVPSLLEMGAAINMLALPIFHLSDLESEPRAVALAATALFHAQRALLGVAR